MGDLVFALGDTTTYGVVSDLKGDVIVVNWFGPAGWSERFGYYESALRPAPEDDSIPDEVLARSAFIQLWGA